MGTGRAARPAGRRVKLVFVNRYFHPDHSATSQILGDLAFHLASAGNDIHVVTSRIADSATGHADGGNVTVHRVADSITGPHSLFRRASAYLNYYLGARSAAMRLVSRGDVVVLKTDPPLLSSAVAHLAKARGAKVIVWLQDIFPEVAKEYGIPGMGGPTGAFLRHMRNRSLAVADAVVAIGDGMAQRIRAMGCVEPERVQVIHNWADGRAITPLDGASNPLRREWNLEDKFVVVYSGNLGRVHEFDTMLAAAARLRDRRDILFLVIGRGPRLAEVQARVARDDLANVRFEPHQDRARLAQSLGVADVHVSVLRPEFEGLVHPSKLYGIMAAGRPTIFVGSVTGETARILAESGCGLSAKTGDSEALAAAILRLRDDPAGRRATGERARQAFEAKYDMHIALEKRASVLGVSARKLRPAQVGFNG